MLALKMVKWNLFTIYLFFDLYQHSFSDNLILHRKKITKEIKTNLK